MKNFAISLKKNRKVLRGKTILVSPQFLSNKICLATSFNPCVRRYRKKNSLDLEDSRFVEIKHLENKSTENYVEFVENMLLRHHIKVSQIEKHVPENKGSSKKIEHI